MRYSKSSRPWLGRPTAPVTSSVKGSQGRARRPAAGGGGCRLAWADGGPVVTVVVRCGPVVRGPDVAPMWPRSRAWKARPVPSSWPAATPLPQLRASLDRPLLTVSDRQMPMLQARGGHGRRGPGWLGRGGDGYHLNPRGRPVLGDYLPRWQGPFPHLLRYAPSSLTAVDVGVATGTGRFPCSPASPIVWIAAEHPSDPMHAMSVMPASVISRRDAH
jgi:hypothetical protein